MSVNGAEKIADLPESAQQAARDRIRRLRATLEQYGEYLTRCTHADVNLGKALHAMWLMSKDLKQTMDELTKLHHG